MARRGSRFGSPIGEAMTEPPVSPQSIDFISESASKVCEIVINLGNRGYHPPLGGRPRRVRLRLAPAGAGADVVAVKTEAA